MTFGGRYDGSPIIVSDGSQPPPDAANVYVPSACPGGRAPHAWLDDGVSLYDLFGFEWTLLQFGEAASAHAGIADAVRALGVDLKLVTLPAALRDLYDADLALIRPDQIVAWRGAASKAEGSGTSLPARSDAMRATARLYFASRRWPQLAVDELVRGD